MTLPSRCPCSTTTGHSRAAATRPGRGAASASPSGDSVPASPTSSAASARAVPPVTGASPTAGVSSPGSCSAFPELALCPSPTLALGSWVWLTQTQPFSPLAACDCGTRLCDEVTGQCICPPHTLKPECVVCEPQTFGCHPLIGCEDCNCSRPGVQDLAEPGCDVDSGQCR